MSEYLFILGRTGDLSKAEIEAVLSRMQINYQTVYSSGESLHLKFQQELDVAKLMSVLGGTIKIASVINKLSNQEDICNQVSQFIQNNIKDENKHNKITFGLSGDSFISAKIINNLNNTIKSKLQENGFIVRFILPSSGTSLSSVVVSKQKVLEFIIISENKEFIIAKTLAIQDFDDWGKRDFQRPAPDPHQGMLPPKVARMMVNIANSKFAFRQETCSMQAIPNSKITLLDPFCGTGTILAEAMMLGLNVIGSDQNQEAIGKTKKNLEWLTSAYRLTTTDYRLIESDATHISEKLAPESVNTIVTEPYLGPIVEAHNMQHITHNIKNTILGLEKLYIGCLREWYKILKPDGLIVIIFPYFNIDNREFSVKKPLDICENLGYTLVSGPYKYSRPQAVVKRNIYILKKINSKH